MEVSKRLRYCRVKKHGRVIHTFCSKPSFSAGVFRTDAKNEFRFHTYFEVKECDALILHGYWHFHEEHGQSLRVIYFQYKPLETKKELSAFIEKFAKVRTQKADKIADDYSSDFENVILNDPCQISRTFKLPAEKIESLRNEWIKNRAHNLMFHPLFIHFDLDFQQASTLFEKYGRNVVQVIKNDPFFILREFPGFNFKKIDRVTLKKGLPENSPLRIKAGIEHCVRTEENNGNSWTLYDDLIEKVDILLNINTPDSRDQIKKILDAMIEGKELEANLVEGKVQISLPKVENE